MAYRYGRKYVKRKYARRSLMQKRRLRIGAMRYNTVSVMPYKNYYKFTRFGVSASIDAGVSGAGTVALNTTANGWAIGSPSLDANGCYQFGGAMQFQLDQVIQNADFGLLFDRYKIKGVRVTIVPLGQPSTNATTVALADTNWPTIAIAVDNDDASMPSDWNSVAVKQDCKIKRLSKPISVYIKNPKLASSVYDGAVTAYTSKTGFLDMSRQDVPHYGLKFFIRDCPLPVYPTGGNGANVMFRVVTKFYLALKDPQ